MLEYAKLNKNRIDLIENSINYALKLPADFSLVLLKDYYYIDDLRPKLFNIPSYMSFLNKRGKLLNVR